MKERLPEWMQVWFGLLVPAAQILAILVVAWLLQWLLRRLIERMGQRHELPLAMAVAVQRIAGFLIVTAAVLAILDAIGLSGTVLWTAFTSFAAVGAIAFFAAWSVLSNIFCSLLIFLTRPFRLNDTVELVENGEKPGFKGRVVDVNPLYTTLLESGDAHSGTVVQIPNSLFFQRTLRRWRGAAVPALPASLAVRDEGTTAKPSPSSTPT